MSRVMSHEDYCELGTCTVRHVGDEVEVVRADERIAVSIKLLLAEHSSALRVLGDGDVLMICGTHTYRATGRVTPLGNPEYVLEEKP